MITRIDKSKDNILGFTLSGKLHDEDYKFFVPAVDEVIAAHGKVRLLAHFVDFHGWDLHAGWDDIKFATTHCTKVDRIALVGDKRWEEWMAKVCKPFTMAKIQYFDATKIDEAWEWLEAETT
ncbi:MAG TPA: STAS/SEC14 domain-containing protein [Planctomycetaceae bacterium]|nr:STAS/SEC14 domain-containing protein [Planctomycetaceae bacterium]|tara:strand:- start:170 stop:535 length:366 start_codon:yes stop_codon:yes gene_type:complete